MSLIKRPKKKNALGNSILGKLVQDSLTKSSGTKTAEIAVVATCGFNLPQNLANGKYEVLRYEDLTEQAQLDLKNAIKTELESDVDLAKLRLIKPALGSNYVSEVIAAIVKLIHTKNPRAMSQPTYIYQGLIDELHRKGADSHDFQYWDKLIEKKALTGKKVEDTIQLHCRFPSSQLIDEEITNVLEAFGFKLPKRIRIAKAARSYHSRSSSTSSLDQLNIRQDLRTALEKNWQLVLDGRLNQLVEAVKGALNPHSISSLESYRETEGAIACEFILRSSEL